MKILGIIPARGGSKGIPKKNIKLLNGKPLLAYTSEIALKSTLLSDVIVSSDDDEIIKVAETLGVTVPFKRPSALAQDDTPTIDVILHALDWYANQEIYFDAVCLLQVTYPFRTLSFLNEAISKFKDSKCDTLISVQKVPQEFNPHWTFEKNSDGYLKIATGEAKIISRRQELPDAYHRDGSIYLTTTKTLLEQNSIYGKRLSFLESASETYVNIDTFQDWERAEFLIKSNVIE
ncbi:acylneuraminate cytidylyltransferase family protein [Bizionia argentinensis JUB59]|uniref:Acylneuraminate cytidylyltransferase family protein n=1 Tax=Bizionia argentinensis JUB59 TaxID=1046627 RepID=G2EAT3_9FLAO|nr:acylneuraminate cytidylyltransferase family protein [Bizionia argentinensis]EGV44350.1 acylneuraminate cytidylyltransferase family protein [Bizionia argentinensis JUB59]